MSGGEDEIGKRSAKLLREGTHKLSGHVRSRLTQARHAAVEEARRSPAAWRLRAPAGALAAAAVLAFMLIGRPTQPELPLPGTAEAAPSAIDDPDLLAGNESFELLEELEFYDWLDAAPPADAEIG